MAPSVVSVSSQQKVDLLWSHFKERSKGQTNNWLRNKIAVAHQGLARKVAHQMADQCAVSYEDLEQIGMIGLVKATDRFDPTKGVAFTSFAVPYIRGEILHYLRKHGSNVEVPRRMREANATANSVERRWLAAYGTLPTEQELADKMDIPLQQLLQVRAAIANQQATSLEEQICEIPEPETWTEDASRHAALEVAWATLLTSWQFRQLVSRNY